MKRLLVLTSRFPYPPIGGDRLRIYEICKYLSSELDLSLLSMCESEEEMNYDVPKDGVFSHIERVFHGKAQRLVGCLRVLPSRTPFQVGYFRNKEFARRLKSLIVQNDGVLAHLIRTGSYVKDCEAPKILEMTDALSLTYKRGEEVFAGSVARSLFYRVESHRLLAYENRMLREFDLSILVSEVDRAVLTRGGVDSRILVCPNGVDTGALGFQYEPDRKTIIFIGNNTARHNADAILYFATEVLPRVRSRIASAQFKVIGRITDKLRTRLGRLNGVVVIGAVENVADAAKHGSVGVCPIRFGAGVQNKVLEYMSLGIPTVTSSIGLEGFAGVPGVHLLIANSSDEWASQICSLLDDPAQGLEFARAGRRLVEENHSWPFMLNPLRQEICRLLDSE